MGQMTPTVAKNHVRASKGAKQRMIPHGAMPCLYLLCRDGKGYWVLTRRDNGRLSKNGKPAYKCQSLGKIADLSPTDARKKAMAIMSGNATGNGRHAAAVGGSFAEAARNWLDDHAGEWKAPSERRRRANYLGVGDSPTFPSMRPLLDMPCAAITSTELVADALRPFWTGPQCKPGYLVRLMIERILSPEAIKRRKPNDPAFANPAAWDGALEHFLSNENKQGKPLASMPWQDVPAFYAATTDSAMRFMILTAARRGEVIGDEDGKPPMDWSEIDLSARTWTVPAERMKAGKAHMVPLSDAAIACLPLQGANGHPGQGTGQVFPGTPKQNIHKFNKLRKGTGITSHGFRSSYTDWVTDTTGDDTIAQLGLAHAVGNKVSRSYRRTTALDKRRESLEAWANFVTGRGGQYGRNS